MEIFKSYLLKIVEVFILKKQHLIPTINIPNSHLPTSRFWGCLFFNECIKHNFEPKKKLFPNTSQDTIIYPTVNYFVNQQSIIT